MSMLNQGQIDDKLVYHILLFCCSTSPKLQHRQILNKMETTGSCHLCFLVVMYASIQSVVAVLVPQFHTAKAKFWLE